MSGQDELGRGQEGRTAPGWGRSTPDGVGGPQIGRMKGEIEGAAERHGHHVMVLSGTEVFGALCSCGAGYVGPENELAIARAVKEHLEGR